MEEVTIIIIAKNQIDFLKQTTKALKDQTYRKFETILVDSGSVDGSISYAKKANIKIIDISKKIFNYAKAFNTGARYAKGKFLVRLSGDCVPANKIWLEELIKPLKNKDCGAVYSKYIYSNKADWWEFKRYWPKDRMNSIPKIHSIKPYPWTELLKKWRVEVYSLAGGSCAIRKDIWGYRKFNEELLAGEDAEYAWFIHLLGLNIYYNPKSQVFHEHLRYLNKSVSKEDIKYNKLKHMIFKRQIREYWLQRVAFNDPYKEVKNYVKTKYLMYN